MAKRGYQKIEMIKKIAIAVIMFCLLGSVAACESTLNTPTVEDLARPPVKPETQSSESVITEQDYLTLLTEISITMGNSLTQFGNLLESYQVNHNEAWTQQVAAQLAIIRSEYGKIADVIPPDSLVDVHDKFKTGMISLNRMTYMIQEGIYNMDADSMNDATDRMEEGTGYLIEAIILMNDFKAVHGL